MMTSGRHRELVVCGPATSAVMALEKVATPGQTAVGRPMAARSRRRGAAHGAETVACCAAAPAAVAGASLPTLPRRLADLATHVPVTQLELLRVRAPGEHRQCAISFVSIAGTDDVVATDGPAGLHRLVTSVTDVVDAATERWGTQFLSSDTGSNAVGLMLTGGVPTSSGNDEDRLLRTVLEVVERCPHVDLRIGVNRWADLLRLRRIAAPSRLHRDGRRGEPQRPPDATCRAQADHRHARRPRRVRVDVRRAAARAVHGEEPRRRPVEASIVVAVVDRDHRGVTHDLPFVGRQHELAELGAIADAAVAGGGAILAIRGDAGVGKSLSCRRVRATAPRPRRRPPRGRRVHRLAGLLTHPQPDRAPRRPRPDGRRRRHSVRRSGIGSAGWRRQSWPGCRCSRRSSRPTCPRHAEVDELADEFRKARLHQAAAAAIDAASGRHLARRRRRRAVDRRGLHRGDRCAQDAAAAARPADQRRRVPPWAAGAIGMRLAQLPDHDAGQLAIAAAAGRLSRRDLIRVAERAGGNPLFLTNLVDAVPASGEVDTLPSTIESLVTRRIDDLDGRDRVFLREAAVAGMEFDLTTLGRVLDSRRVAGAGVWRRLAPFVGAREPGRMRFLHGMYQRVAYEGLSFRRRRELHLAARARTRRSGGRAGRALPALLACRAPRSSLPLVGGGRRPGAADVRQRRGRRALPPRTDQRRSADAGTAPGAPSWPRPSATCSSCPPTMTRRDTPTTRRGEPAATPTRRPRRPPAAQDRRAARARRRLHRCVALVCQGDPPPPCRRHDHCTGGPRRAGAGLRRGAVPPGQPRRCTAAGAASDRPGDRGDDDRVLGHAYSLLTVIDVAR